MFFVLPSYTHTVFLCSLAQAYHCRVLAGQDGENLTSQSCRSLIMSALRPHFFRQTNTRFYQTTRLTFCIATSFSLPNITFCPLRPGLRLQTFNTDYLPTRTQTVAVSAPPLPVNSSLSTLPTTGESFLQCTFVARVTSERCEILLP